MKKVFILVLVNILLLCFGMSVSAQSTIRINEFATNGATQYNGMDWVELYNPSDQEVSLEGYTLDDAKSATETNTAVLSGTIPAKGFKVLIEGTDFQFGLGASGETLTLKLNNNVVDQIVCTPNIAGKTLGRISDGEGSANVTFNGEAIDGWRIYDEADATIGASNNIITVVYTSDQHYGITRSDFRGATDVDATVVNAAMVAQINKLNNTILPNDGNVGGDKLMNVSHIITTGDISNRAESGIAKSAVTLAQFDTDYNNITLQNFKGEKPELLLLPGNHDVSNAIGQGKILTENIDATTLAAIYNRMMSPATPKTASTYNYTTDKINYVRTIGGVQFVFVTMWPDHAQREWIAANTNSELPIFIFTHDEPDVETKHLIDPSWTSGTPLDFSNKFEYLVDEVASNPTTDVERDEVAQRAFANFVEENQNIKAYFHGNTNFNEFYTYEGPDANIQLPTFRIDSPMKGEVSGDDESKLSFLIISIDKATQKMTVRECLWNSTSNDAAPITFGESKTIDKLNETISESDYTVPSWTLYQRSIIAGTPNESVLVTKDAPYNVNTVFNGDPTSQFGVTWYMNEGVTGTELQLIEGTSGDFSAARVINPTETALDSVMYVTSGNKNDDLITKTGFTKGEKRSYISNKVLINNLQPNTTYSYRVGGINDNWSEVYSFTTAKDNKDEFSFIYITDTQANDDEMFDVSRKTVETAQTNVPDAKFVLMTGDLVETSGNSNSEWEWEQWFETMKSAWKNLPIAPAQGNHDTSEKYSNWHYHFNTDTSYNTAQTDADAKTAMKGATYSFVYGDALFMVLTWEDYRKDETYFSAVENWMREQIEANEDVKWKIVAFHKNMFTGSKSHQSDTDGRTVRERMAPAFQDMGINLVFEGHDHVYEVMGVMVAGKEGDTNTYTKVEGAVTGQTFETPNTATNNNPDMTGIHGGTFNVNNGVLYFLNNSAGKKKYQPRTEQEMIDAENVHRVPGYYQFFHRFGQTGEPTFSKVSISTDTIKIVTYTVNDEGVPTEFDAFKVIKEEMPKEEDYTIPSWTLYMRTIKAGNPDISVLVSKDFAYNINTTINGDPTTQIGATWFTNSGVANTKIQVVAGANVTDFTGAMEPTVTTTAVNDLMYIAESGNSDQVVEATGLEKGCTRSYVSNKALINGLEPNTTYSYRIGNGETWSETGTFTTAKNNKETFSFLYITDTQAYTDEMFDVSATTVKTAHETATDAKFLLCAGDFVDSYHIPAYEAYGYTGSAEWEWEQWFAKMQSTWMNLPIVPVQGNHDISPSNNWFHHFNTDTSYNDAQTVAAAKTNMDGTIYSFEYGDALFMVINFENIPLPYEASDENTTYINAVAEWLRTTAAANTDAKWKIVAFHKSMFTGSASHQDDQDGRFVRENIAPVLQEIGVDLVLEGHDHVYEVIGVLVAGKDGETNTYEHLADAVSGQNEVTPTPADGQSNSVSVTGKEGGVFNVQNGVLYFLNNSAGEKKYFPRNEQQMIDAEATTGVPDYFKFFNKFGQTGDPTFSKITVSTDVIEVTTYTVDDEGEPTEFDSFEVVKNGEGTSIITAKSQNKITVYPNPSSDKVFIESEEKIENVRILSLNGQELLSQNKGNQIDVSGLSEGVYILSVRTADKNIYSEKLIVKK